MPDAGMYQQVWRNAPQQLFAHLWSELNLDRLKIFQLALWRNKRIIGAKEETILKARRGFA